MILKGAVIVLAFVSLMAFLMFCICAAVQEEEEGEDYASGRKYECYRTDDDD